MQAWKCRQVSWLVASVGTFGPFFGIFTVPPVVVVVVSSRVPVFCRLVCPSHQRPLFPHVTALAYPAAPSRTPQTAQRHRSPECNSRGGFSHDDRTVALAAGLGQREASQPWHRWLDTEAPRSNSGDGAGAQKVVDVWVDGQLSSVPGRRDTK